MAKRRGVDEAKDTLGSIGMASAGKVTTQAVYRWMEAGRIRDAGPLLRVAEAVEPKDAARRWALARRLAGLTE